MKSQIKIDIDNDGLPVLLVRLSHDETDVRDKLLNRFFRYTETSNLLTFRMTGGSISLNEPSTSSIEIYPVKDVMISSDHSECMFGVMSRDEVVKDYVLKNTEPYVPEN